MFETPCVKVLTRAGVVLLFALACRTALAAPNSVFLEDLTWTEARDQIKAGKTTVIVPIGGTEQSGPQIALGKHNVRVRYLCGEIARNLGNAVVAPVIAYVPEGNDAPPTSHMRFAGTISVPDDVFEKTLVAAANSLRTHGFVNIVFLGDHGGYQKNIRNAVARLDKAWAGKPAHAIAPAVYYETSTDGFAKILRARGYRDDEIGTHAALADTSLQLAVAPDMVRSNLLQSDTRFGPAVGVYGGDPRRASAELGRLGVEAIVARTVEAIKQTTAR